MACANVNLLKNSMELDYDGSPETAAAVVAAIEESGYGAARRARPGERSAAAPAERPGAAAEQRHRARGATQLIVSAVFSVPLFYVAMGPMFGWPQPRAARRARPTSWRSALTQLLLCAPILLGEPPLLRHGLPHALAPRAQHGLADRAGVGGVGRLVRGAALSHGVGRGRGRRGRAPRRGPRPLLRLRGHDPHPHHAGQVLSRRAPRGAPRTPSPRSWTSRPRRPRSCATARSARSPPRTCVVGERVIVRAGESVPVDGVVVEGSAAIDEAAITGERVPREVAPGDRVTGATVCTTRLARAGGARRGRRHHARRDHPPRGRGHELQGPHRAHGGQDRRRLRARGDRHRGGDVRGLARARGRRGHGAHARHLDPRDLLPVRARAGHAHGHHGGHRPRRRQRDPDQVRRGARDRLRRGRRGARQDGHRDGGRAARDGRALLAPGVSEDELLRVAAALERRSEHPLAVGRLRLRGRAWTRTGERGARVEGFEQVPGGGLAATVDGAAALAGNARLMEGARRGAGRDSRRRRRRSRTTARRRCSSRSAGARSAWSRWRTP